MRSGGWLTTAALALVGSLAGCTVGDGLRVEGPATSGTPSVGVKSSPQIAEIAPSGLDLPTIREVLLADAKVETEIRDVVRTCRPECVQLGPSADIVGTGKHQQVVTVSARNGGAFVAFLVGELNSAKPRVLWSVEEDDMKVVLGKGRSLIVESVVFGRNDRACCPTGRKVGTYEWSGTRIVKRDEKFIPGAGG